ncbi:MAG: PEGA domain-containing protein [Parachlamydiaceae bacterium]|nr:PEGA domain-containing protein [Parachlamydiaceae bacterium]
MKNKLLKHVLGCLLLLSTASCSTMVNGPRQSIAISSNPTDAYVWVDQHYMGVTPLIVDMKRKNNHVVRIELEGFQPFEAVFSKRLSGWVFGNIAFGGIIGFAIDAMTGSMYRLTPGQINAELYTYQVVHNKKTEDSHVMIVLDPDPSWEKVGNLVPISNISEESAN